MSTTPPPAATKFDLSAGRPHERFHTEANGNTQSGWICVPVTDLHVVRKGLAFALSCLRSGERLSPDEDAWLLALASGDLGSAP